MKGKQRYDITLFCVIITLVALGFIMVLSASQIIARERFSSAFFFLEKHAVRVVIGMIALFVCMRFPYRRYQKAALPLLVISFALLAAVLFIGIERRGASRWLSIFNVVFQPVEVAKLGLVIYFASKIDQLKGDIKDLRKGFLPLAIPAVLMAALVVLQPNISNVFIIVALSFLILFVAGCRLRHLAASGAVLIAVALPFAYRMEHVYARLIAWLNRGQDLHGINWQFNQSLIALGSGFIFGSGPGRGHQKFSFLPDAHTDFIYAIIGEEFGVVGTVIVLALFAFVFRRAIRAAQRAPNTFGYVLALGIGMSIFATASLNMAMTLGMIPTAGLPLPFVSYGGSSLITSLAGIGILLNISSQGKETVHVVRETSSRRSTSRVFAKRVNGRGKRTRSR